MTSQAIAMNRVNTIKRERTHFTIKQTAYQCITGISALAVMYLLSVFITGTAWLPIAQGSTSAELRLSLVECLLGLVALNIPALIGKVCRVKLPDALCVGFYIFVFCATVLGELFSMYYAFPCWDIILHSASGLMIGLLGAILVKDFLRRKGCEKLITPALVAVVAVCFALCVGVVWEFYEFSVDSLLGLNMQKTTLMDGTALVGKAAVFDTMKDLIMDFLGGTVAAAGAFVSLKHRQREAVAYKPGAAVFGELSVCSISQSAVAEPKIA